MRTDNLYIVSIYKPFYAWFGMEEFIDFEFSYYTVVYITKRGTIKDLITNEKYLNYRPWYPYPVCNSVLTEKFAALEDAIELNSVLNLEKLHMSKRKILQLTKEEIERIISQNDGKQKNE